ncbi:MAG: radical SAM family heme chaperone HemW, partial [Candidatus Atribacteria bacterium]|nr:radical SAM family heme chaperone HemW [Candidatus Atribacteria bacterium]
MRTLSLYFHVPFCQRKCSYCDFTSFPWGNQDVMDRYFLLLQKEIELRIRQNNLDGCELQSIYFGGGTPSLVDPRWIPKVFSFLTRFFRFSPSMEITIEVNPGTIDGEWLKTIRNVGVNRLSIGVQSFDDRYLRFLGRTYHSFQVLETLTKVQEIFFPNYSVDLIYSLPFQSLSDWEKEVETLLFFYPPHISIYNLTLHREVPLYRFRKQHDRVFPTSDEEAIFYRWTIQELESHGYLNYEISNFAQPGYECQHNLGYWKNREYLGVGISAWSYLSGVREMNTHFWTPYCRQVAQGHLPVVFHETLTHPEKLNEDLILALRTSEGVVLDD